jgi:hypothetical protein
MAIETWGDQILFTVDNQGTFRFRDRDYYFGYSELAFELPVPRFRLKV